MNKNTSISLGNHFQQFINETIESGRFHSASEVIRAGLRLLEDQETKIQNLREALIEGEKSGIVKDFDPIKLKEKLNKSVQK